jgi:hypothetical protein
MELLVELAHLTVTLVLLHHYVLLVPLHSIWFQDNVHVLMDSMLQLLLYLLLETPPLTSTLLTLTLLLTLLPRESYNNHANHVQNNVLNVVQLPYVPSVLVDTLSEPLIILAKLTSLLSLASITSL